MNRLGILAAVARQGPVEELMRRSTEEMRLSGAEAAGIDMARGRQAAIAAAGKIEWSIKSLPVS